jgi:serine/threonine protein kinase
VCSLTWIDIEYAPYGSLASAYMKPPAEDAHPTLLAGSKYLPELFIWIVFKNLVGACYSLRRRGIVHADIKPDNVLIVEDNRDPENGFKYPVLSDFEQWFRVDAEPMWDNLGSYTRFMAPEQHGPFPASAAKVDVFQIGATLFAVMRGVNRFAFTGPYSDEGPLAQRIREMDKAAYVQYEAPYSKLLEDLVMRCVEADSDDRPDIASLQADVLVGIEVFDCNNGRKLGKKITELPEWWRMHFKRGEFEIGARLGDSKKRRLWTATKTFNTSYNGDLIHGSEEGEEERDVPPHWD